MTKEQKLLNQMSKLYDMRDEKLKYEVIELLNKQSMQVIEAINNIENNILYLKNEIEELKKK